MDTDESEQIILEKSNIKERKRKNNWENLLKLEINENNKIQCFFYKIINFNNYNFDYKYISIIIAV